MGLPLTNQPKKPYCVSNAAYLTVGDLKQYSYCARIPYFMKILGVAPPPTYLMECGKNEEEKLARRQRRHRLSRFGFVKGLRHHHVWIVSKELALSGVIDLVIESDAEVAVIDFKTGKKYLRDHHNLQIAAYALLAEEHFGKPCRRGYLFYADSKEWVNILITNELREETRDTLCTMKEMVRRSIFPDPTPDIGKCQRCEYLNFCGDRW